MQPAKLLSLTALIASLAFSAGLRANGFESNGIVDEVNPDQNLITVGEEIFRLPNSTLFEGGPAMFQLQPGYQIGFSGEIAAPYPVITSVYIYPESVRRVQMGLEP